MSCHPLVKTPTVVSKLNPNCFLRWRRTMIWALAETDPSSCHSVLVDYIPGTLAFSFFLELAKLALSSLLPLPATPSTWLAPFDPTDLCFCSKASPHHPLLTALPLLAPLPQIFPRLGLIFIIIIVTDKYCSFIYLLIHCLSNWIVSFLSCLSSYSQLLEGSVWYI